MSGSGSRGGWKKRYSPEELAKQAAKEAEWRAILADWRASNLDGRSYAKLKGISEHVFYSWKRVIRLRDKALERKRQAKPSSSRPEPSIRKRKVSAAKKSALFLPLRLKSSGFLEIRHTSGHTVIVHEGCSGETLRSVLDAFERN